MRGISAQAAFWRLNLARWGEPPVASPLVSEGVLPPVATPPVLAANVPPETEGMSEQPQDNSITVLLKQRLRGAFLEGEPPAPALVPDRVPLPATKEVTAPPSTAPAASTTPEAVAEPKKKTRSGSEARQRQPAFLVRVTPQEQEAIREKAQTAGLSIGAYFRKAALGAEGVRARPAPSVNRELMAEALAALNRVGNNVNQIAHHLNAGGTLSHTHIDAALVAVKEAAKTVVAALGRSAP